MNNKRYGLLDGIRGLILISMIAYHTVWDIVYIFGEKWSWYQSNIAYVWQQSICWSFILLSGFCWSFGRKKWKRGLIVFGGGVIVSIVTLIAMPDNRILFGILTLLGSSMLLLIPLAKVLKKLSPYLGVIISFLLFLVCKDINNGHVGLGKSIILPKEWYANLLTAYLGFPSNGFFSTDYFSLLPWFFLFVSGYFIHGIFKKKQWFGKLDKSINGELEKLGRHSLIVYMLHQPFVYGVLSIIYMCK